MTPIYQFPLNPHMQMGDVTGIGGLKLSVGTGPDNSSVLTSKRHDVALEKHTLLLLVPPQAALLRPAAGGAAAQPAAAGGSGTSHTSVRRNHREGRSSAGRRPRQLRAAGVQRRIAARHCRRGRPGQSHDLPPRDWLCPTSQRRMEAFDHDEALAYLSPRELLVAFNPHILVPRHRLGPSGWTIRVIRAALIDIETQRVLRTVDWDLPDTREYLWPLTEGRVLVHVGSELRVYGEGLDILNRIPLEGPLSFVRVSPDGTFPRGGRHA